MLRDETIGCAMPLLKFPAIIILLSSSIWQSTIAMALKRLMKAVQRLCISCLATMVHDRRNRDGDAAGEPRGGG